MRSRQEQKARVTDLGIPSKILHSGYAFDPGSRKVMRQVVGRLKAHITYVHEHIDYAESHACTWALCALTWVLHCTRMTCTMIG